MKFNINDYKSKYAMHCKTEEEAKSFCEFLDSVGRTWIRGGSYKSKNMWYEYKEKTCYNFNEGTYGRIGTYQDLDYTILEWSDFMNTEFTKADLKTGDVIKRRNGNIEIVNRELEMFITKTGWNNFDNIREDLTHISNQEQYDIVAVRRPKDKADCQFKTFALKYGTLVYERKEVEEMTLAEVCRLLGKEIKIVKG